MVKRYSAKSFRHWVDAVGCGAIVKDSQKHIAGFRRRVRAEGSNLAVDDAGIFRDDLTECIALNRDLLPGRDFILEVDEKLDEAAAGREHAVTAVADKET